MTLHPWMMHAPLWTGVAMAVPAAVAPLVLLDRPHARVLACIAASISAAACAILLALQRGVGAPFPALMLLYAGITLGTCLVLPRRDSSGAMFAAMLFMLATALLAYSAATLWMMLAAWVLSLAPFLLPGWLPRVSGRMLSVLLLSSLALAIAVGCIATLDPSGSITALAGRSPGGAMVFALLLVAVVLRAGLWPAHAWVVDAAEVGSMIPAALLLNGNLGAMLVARALVPLYPGLNQRLPLLFYLGLGTAIYAAIRALAEDSPRRLLALLALSQSALIVGALQGGTIEEVAAAAAQWCVVAVSTMALFGILRLLEVRFGENLRADRHLGLAGHAPRLAVSFAVFGLALVGLPGTLGFCAQDLVIQGALNSHPFIGLLLPVATAMNAVSVFRLFTRLFLGQRRTGFTLDTADALPRERWALAAGLLFLVLGGLFPNLIVAKLDPHAQTSSTYTVGKSGSPLFAGSLPQVACGRASTGGSGRPLCSWRFQSASIGMMDAIAGDAPKYATDLEHSWGKRK